jgi:hypothetical protein
MAFPTTLAGWISYVRDYLNADEYTDTQIQAFLDLAQNRLNKEMQSFGMEADIRILIDLSMVGIPIPMLTIVPDFNKIRLVSVVDVGPLDVAAINEMKKYQEQGDNTGNPCHYTIDANKLYIYPGVAENNSIDVFYYVNVPLLETSIVETNVFSVKHPDALLYAACLEAAAYMVEDERIPVWENKYANALIVANTEPSQIKMGSTPLVRKMP